MEAAVRWSPRATHDRQRFLLVDIADQSLALHAVDSLSRDAISHHAIARSPKLASFSAFDWSKTQESIVAVGHVSGSATLVKLYDDGRPSETPATFRLKQQRKCNSLAFSTRDWLAVGVDKTRSDVCLFIYDVARDQPAEPVKKLCAAELVNSVRFFSSQPETIVTGTSRAFLRIYDLRDGFHGPGGNVQVSTKCVNNLAVDPRDENYFASAGPTDDPTVTVWDRRWMPQAAGLGSGNGAVFEFRPVLPGPARNSVRSLRFSTQQRGRLAICSGGGELRVIDTKEGNVLNPHSGQWNGQASYVSNAPEGAQWTNPTFGADDRVNQPYVSADHIVETAPLDAKQANQRLVAFDWISDGADTFSEQVIALRQNRELGILNVPSARIQAELTPRNDLSMALQDISIAQPRHHQLLTAIRAPYEQPGRPEPEDFGPHEYAGEAEGPSEDNYVARRLDSPALHRLLASSNHYRERCEQGYLFDCDKNARIVAGDWQLERLWEIVGRFREQSGNMVHTRSNVDFAYVGVKGIWLEEVDNLGDRRSGSGKPGKMRDAIIGLNKVNQLPAFEGERTSFPEHRQLCLMLCGWKFTPDTLEAECNELVERGLHYQAVVQAVLHGNTHLALNLLRSLIRSRTIPNIGLGALLASSTINAAQRDMCHWMAADTDDAALRALLAYLASGDWRDVMKTPYLHLGYRLALGCKYLNDTELSGFIAAETARAVRYGEPEGALLTGLAGGDAMDLFQTRVARTGDVQTAVLATACAYPRYGAGDVRWEAWREAYFEQMQRWRCFAPRALFTVQHARMAQGAAPPAPEKQLVLRCAHCQGNMAQRDTTNSASKNGVRVTGPAAHAGTVCPTCGRHMPRCALCQLWLGTADPRQRGEGEGVGGGMDGGKEGEVAGKEEGDDDEEAKLDATMAKLLSFCARCGHGYHAHHARMWFARHRACAVAECGCLCRG